MKDAIGFCQQLDEFIDTRRDDNGGGSTLFAVSLVIVPIRSQGDEKESYYKIKNIATGAGGLVAQKLIVQGPDIYTVSKALKVIGT